MTWERNGPWEPRVRDECLAVRDGVGVLEIPGFSKFALSGPGAADWLRSLVAGNLPRVGRMGLAYFATDKGRALTEMSVLRHEEDSFTLITAAAAQWHDLELLRHTLPRDGRLLLDDRTSQESTLLVTGPSSRELLSGVVDADLDLPWLSHQPASACGRRTMLARVSYAGELGWEIHAPNEAVAVIHDAVIAAGAVPFGMWALNSLRLEKGYLAWKGDISTDYTLLESGLDRFVRLDKPEDFPGKRSLPFRASARPVSAFVDACRGCRDVRRPLHGNNLAGWKGCWRSHLRGLGLQGGKVTGIGNA